MTSPNTGPATPDAVADAALMAMIRDMQRFKRAAGAVTALHRPEGEKCRECRKPWPCPTETALLSGLRWDGRGDESEGNR